MSSAPKARVAMFLPNLKGGGAERISVHLANELAERGYRTELVLAEAAGTFLADVSPKVKVVDLGAKRLASAILPLVRYLRAERPDVLFSHLDYANVVALLARRLARVPTRVVPVVHITHSQAHSHSRSRREPLLRHAIKLFYPSADRIVSVSQGSATDMMRMTGVPESLLRVIYNPAITPGIKALSEQRADHRWLQPGGPPVILAIGRLTRQKDFATLIRAFALMEDSDRRLLILGDGEERQALERLVAELSLGGKVDLPGFVKNPYACLARCSLFALSSAWEALPTVLLEALSLGVPVVSTDCPAGPREILHDGKYGRLSPVGDVKSLARAMQDALRGPRLEVPAEALLPFTLKASVDEYIKTISDMTRPACRLAYIAACAPFSRTESFVLDEICSVKKIRKEVVIVPRNPPKELFHEKAGGLAGDAIWLPLINANMLVRFAAALTSARVRGVVGAVARESRGWTMLAKNLAVLPKSVYAAALLQKRGVEHIHAHWGGTTTTMAYAIHRLTGIPFSFTLHRWDIYADNMLKLKVSAATFARCISERGRRDVLAIIGAEFAEKVPVVHMGVALPGAAVARRSRAVPVLLTPANLLPVKGHRYMISACALLKRRGIILEYWIAGEGPLERALKRMAKAEGVADRVRFLGPLPHEKLLRLYEEGAVDLVILPSVNADGHHEGIPVALMEAMAYGIPVVSTDTGSIPELIDGGGGVMVAEKNAAALADAVGALLADRGLRARIGRHGRRNVERNFEQSRVAARLCGLMEAAP